MNLYHGYEEWCETNNHIQQGPKHDKHLTILLFMCKLQWEKKLTWSKFSKVCQNPITMLQFF